MAQELSCFRRFLSALENTKKKRTGVLGLQFPQNTKLFLDFVFMLLPGVADRTELTSDYSLLLADVI